MTTILEKIIANKRVEVERDKERRPLAILEKSIRDVPQRNSFRQTLVNSKTGIIAEFKRRSPSRNWIHKEAQVEEIIPLYSLEGASALSVLTDYDFFGGTLADLKKASELTDTPILRKDFVIDEYQLYQAKECGASAVLLIASALSLEENKALSFKAKELGLDVLLEIHHEQEIDYINDGVDVVGINNRNLKTFVTDVQISFDLGAKIPGECLKISESGISDPKTVIDLRREGFQGFLMGECFMKTKNPGKALANFIKEFDEN